MAIGRRQTLAREVSFYSETVREEEVLNLFDQILKARIPLMGIIDLSGILSFDVVRVIATRRSNTVNLYFKEKESMRNLSPLIFPFSLSESTAVEERQSAAPLPRFYVLDSRYDFISYMLKDDVCELSLRIMKLFGTHIGVGRAITDGDKERLLLVTNPERFFAVDLERNPALYMNILDPMTKKIAITSDYPIFEETNINLGVNNYDPLQHTLIVGASGAGKSMSIYLLARAIEKRYGRNVRIVIIDPHQEFTRLFSDAASIDFIDSYVEPLDIGGQKSPLMTQLVAQLISSSIGQENKYSERILFYAVHLLSSIDLLTLKNISSLLTDAPKRAEFLSICRNGEVKRFFDEEYGDILLHNFNNAILPILNFIGEYELYLGKVGRQENLFDTIQKNRVTIISFNPNFFGKNMIRFLSGAIMNQMYIMAITNKFDKPVVFVMDEFPTIETKVVRGILSEARKFNLYAYISLQYLLQINREILDSIISNVRNIIAFKLNKQDAAVINSMMEIKMEEYFKKHRSANEIEEAKKEIFVKLQQQEAVVRLFDGKSYLLPMKLRVVDASRWGYVPSDGCNPVGLPPQRDGNSTGDKAGE